MIFRIIGEEFLWENSHEDGKESAKFRKIGPSQEGLDYLKTLDVKIIDTETTGLKWMKNDKIFSMAIAGVTGVAYYVNFQDYIDLQIDLLDTFELDWVFKSREKLLPIFENEAVWVGHNLKFDYHMLYRDGFKLKGHLIDTMIEERLLSNNEFRYNLASVVKRNLPDMAKDDAVEDYISDNGLYTTEEIPGKKGFFQNKHYSLVPFRVIAPYAANDVIITRDLHLNQQERFVKETAIRDQTNVRILEANILKICCGIEQHGVLLDREYCAKGLEFELKRSTEVEAWFREEFKKDFVDSALGLTPIFLALGYNPPKTEKNNDSISGDFLATVTHELARKIEIHRDSYKRANTYFRSFLSLADKNNILHPDMKQTGTLTGRFSYSDPNLQNIPSEDTSEFPIRRVIIPRPGHFFVMIDYQQQEFRMLLEYAKEMELIEKIKQGHDPHQATADLTGLSRKAAKTLNFALMYGAGIQRIADQIGVTYDEAKSFKQKYFAALPHVRQFIYAASDRAKDRGAVYTWLNRKLDFKDPNFAYKAVNGIIQGGCADVTKLSMVENHRLTSDMGLKSRILMQIHDELLFEIPYEEVGVVKLLQQSMEQAYPHKHIPLTTSLSYSLKSFHDAIEVESFFELEKAIREYVSENGKEVLRDFTKHLVCENPATNH